MSADFKGSIVGVGLTVLFLGLASAFWLNLWGKPSCPALVPSADPQFTNTATVRMSAAELIRTGGDTSGLACNACHDEKKPVALHLDASQNVILADEHKDLVVRHGRHNRNNLCFNCHDQARLELLQTRDGRKFKIEESTPLCGSCHGPTYRDWEAGIHGRLGGYWRREQGAVVRQDCVSCHDPHAPAFPSMTPGPGPHLLHAGMPAAPKEKETH